jgi:hypothetical protein
MTFAVSTEIHDDIRVTIEAVMRSTGIINVPVLAEQIRVRNARFNAAIEDIEQAIVDRSRYLSASMMFDRQSEN